MDSPIDSLSLTGAPGKLGYITLCSDNEHEITIVSAHRHNQMVKPSASLAFLETERMLESLSKSWVRQDATVQVTSDSRTSNEETKSGVSVSLVSLENIAKKTLRCKMGGIGICRKIVARFERTNGPIEALLSYGIHTKSGWRIYYCHKGQGVFNGFCYGILKQGSWQWFGGST